MRILKSVLAVAAVSAACIVGSSAANAQWWGYPGYGWGYPSYRPGVSIGIGGPRGGFYITSGVPYYYGYRGYHYYRPGYRSYNGYWFPAAAFAAIAGAAVASAPYRGGNAHVQWCYQNYRSYRASDDTFQPYHGPRQRCISPY
jgi:hypothetical protein